ncbi:MAG: lytic transglycosylase domain-containing protein [Lachnospiraceae bacterium]
MSRINGINVGNNANDIRMQLQSTHTAYSSAYSKFQDILRLAQTEQGIKPTGANAYGRFNKTVTGCTESMDAIFEEAADTYGVPLNLLKAVAKAESNFNADDVSSAGAIGVMQLMPATAASLGVTDPYDARSNIMGGAKYLAEKLQQYNGDVELALASYNAGSGNVRKYGGVPPFKETRNYIKRVLGYAQETITIGKEVTGKIGNIEENKDITQWQVPLMGLSNPKEMCLYMIESMKMQMQMDFQMALNSSDNSTTDIDDYETKFSQSI